VKRSISNSLAGTLSAEITIVLFGAASGTLTARLLHPDGRGALAAIILWPQLVATIGLLSLNEATTFRIGADPDQRPRTMGAALSLASALAAISSILAYYSLPFLLGAAKEPLVSIARVYALTFIPFNYLSLVTLSRVHGSRKFLRYNVLRVLPTALNITGLIALAYLHQISAAAAAVTNAVANVAFGLLCAVLILPLGIGLPHWQDARSLLRRCFSFHPSAVLILISFYADQMLLLRMVDNRAIGLYAVALTVASTVLAAVTSAFQVVLFPTLASRGPSEQNGALVARSIRHAMAILLSISAVLAVLAPFVIAFFFGAAYRAATPVCWILLGAYSLVALKTVCIQLLRGIGEGKPGTIAAGLSLTVFLLAAPMLVLRLGIAGAGIGVGIGNFAAFAYLLIHMKRVFHLSLTDFWGLSPTNVRSLLNSLQQTPAFQVICARVTRRASYQS